MRILFFLPVLFIAATADAQDLPGLRVQGRFLYAPDGEKVILKGANTMIVYWDIHGDINYPELARTGANACRIFWNLAYPKPQPTDLDITLQNCINNHMIPIICLWDATGDWTQLQNCVDYWTSEEIATILKKHEKYLIVNIANEAGSSAMGDNVFKSKYEDLVNQMRTAGIHTPLIIDSDGWGRNASSVLNNGAYLLEKDPDHNLVFSWHVWDPSYWGTGSKTSIKNIIDLSVEKELPFLVGEFGPCEQCDRCAATAIEWQYLIQYCTENEIGWLAWVWRWTDCHSLVKFDPGIYGDWTNNPWGEQIAVSSPYSIQNTSVRPAYLLSSIRQQGSITPSFRLFPNPASTELTVECFLPEAAHVRMELFDLTGRLYSVLIDQEESPGMSRQHMAINVSGKSLSPGIYLYQISSAGKSDLNVNHGELLVIE